MAMPSRTLPISSPILDHFSLVPSITSLLQTIKPQKSNLTKLSTTPLHQFSPYLDSDLVIKVINQQTNPYHALFFFNWASNPNPNPRNYSLSHSCYVAIIDLLLSHSLLSTAASVLQKSDKLSDFFVSKFVKACGDCGNIRNAIFWVNEAKRLEKGRCLYSYNAILGVLVRRNHMELAKKVYDQIVKDGVVQPDVSTYTTMIRGFCKMGMIYNARKVFDEMLCPPNLLTFNTMINGYCKKGDMESALMLLNSLMTERKRFQPDIVTYTTLIDGYCKKSDFEEALNWMNEMVKRGCKPNVLTYNAIIYGLCLNGKVDEASRMMTKMRLNGLKDNVATQLSMLKGLCVAGRSDEAVKYLRKLISSGVNLDPKSYGVVVNEYCKMKKPHEAISILKEMRGRGICPSVSSFNAVSRILVECGLLDRAILLLKQMPKMGCKPNFISYHNVIHGVCCVKGRMQEVEGLVSEMLCHGLKIDAAMYSSLVKGYCENGNEEMAKRILYDSVKEGHIIDLESFTILTKELCAKKKVAEAEKIFKEMNTKCPIVHVESYKRVLDKQLLLCTGNVENR